MQIINLTLKYWKSAVINALILYLSFAPPSEFKGIPTFNNEDKLIHLLMYMGLTVILLFDSSHIHPSHKISLSKLILLCVVYPVVLGGAIEILQPLLFYPRTASWFDWIADTVGVIVGWYGMKLYFRKLKPGFIPTSGKQ